MEIRETNAGRKALTNFFREKKVVELGVERGKYSLTIMESGAEKLWAVDLWHNYAGYREHVDDSTYLGFLDEAKKRLEGKNVEFVVSDTISAAENFEDESVDVVYHDSNHTYEHVAAELRAWYSKVRAGGIISGHDFSGKHGGVRKAVVEFATEKGIEEIIEWCGDKSHSFSFQKP